MKQYGTMLPGDSAARLRCLNLFTDLRNGVSPKKCNRRIYILLSSLKAYGDFGQHQAGQEVTPGFAAAVALTAVELARELLSAGLVASKTN
jgi:hypothetical protein